ncbi:hypothetical protein MARI151_10093 [Maribacter litoralis]|uniref:Uncharacterized protein n=1 Tax=Maribacter litoralis TaxID=2059726 RepID=A0A653LP11_9FLAO|nr:hypothetical protein MARI151_10093 [Maribacter litoralis]
MYDFDAVMTHQNSNVKNTKNISNDIMG